MILAIVYVCLSTPPGQLVCIPHAQTRLVETEQECQAYGAERYAALRVEFPPQLIPRIRTFDVACVSIGDEV